MVGCERASHPSNLQVSLLPLTTLHSVLRILRWAVLALALAAVGRAMAEDSRPLDLDATRSALTAIETALKNQNLTDADLQRLRAESDPLGVALQAVIADMTPRLATSVKRLAELTPKSKESAPATDAATAELASEKQRHDALDANLRAARAMLLEVDDVATRVGAKRRELFARETFARILQRLQSAALAERVARGPHRRRHDGPADRRLACRPDRTVDDGPDARHGRRCRSPGARRGPDPLGRAPGGLSRPRRGVAEPVSPRDCGGLDHSGACGPAPSRALGGPARSRRVRPLRTGNAGRCRRRSRRRASHDHLQCDRSRHAGAPREGVARGRSQRPFRGADSSRRNDDRRDLGRRAVC